MRIKLSYITIILLWATTPLAIKWSGEGPGFLFGVTARMAIGTVCVLIVLTLIRQRLTGTLLILSALDIFPKYSYSAS
jgi:hypothetical protein